MATAAVIPGLFTIVITVFEREYLLPYALQSLAWQTYQNLEILIYADGPSPRTAALLETITERYKWLADKIHYSELTRGPGLWGNHLRERGAAEARGEFLAFLSHDSIYHPDLCHTHVSALSLRPCVSVASATCWLANDRLEYLDVFPTQAPGLATYGQIHDPCVAYPTEHFRRHVNVAEVRDSYAWDYNVFDRARRYLPIVFHAESGPLAANM